MWLLRKMVVIAVSSNKFWKVVQNNSLAFMVQKMLHCQFVKNSSKLNSPSLLKGQRCDHKIYTRFFISNDFFQLSLIVA